jgi:hypothetical protein
MQRILDCFRTTQLGGILRNRFCNLLQRTPKQSGDNYGLFAKTVYPEKDLENFEGFYRIDADKRNLIRVLAGRQFARE